MQIPRQRGTLPCGLEENKLYWPVSRTYDRAAGQTIFTLRDRKADRRWTSPARRRASRTAGDDEPGGPGYFKETISIYARH